MMGDSIYREMVDRIKEWPDPSNVQFDSDYDGERWEETNKMYRIEILSRPSLLGQRWWWRLLAGENDQILAHSEKYSRRIDCVAVAVKLGRALRCEVVYQ
jgi:hypothetical protein